jgi:hypothetical protein
MCEKRMSKRNWHRLCDQLRSAELSVDLEGRALVRVEMEMLLLMLSRQVSMAPPNALGWMIELFRGGVKGNLVASLKVNT